jgi:Fe-S-cluster containining protein
MNKTEELLEQLEENKKEYLPQIEKAFKRIKKKKPKKLDTFVHNVHDEIFEEIDCLSCGNCCKALGPRITDVDISRMAKHLRIKPSKVVTDYLILDEDNDYVFKSMPCPFLMPDNYCMIYESRPKACREYPHTDRKKFFQLLDLSILNLDTCPAVMEVSKAIVKEFS